MIQTSTVFDGSTRVTDGHKDRQMDVWAIAYSKLSIHRVSKKTVPTYIWLLVCQI